MHRQRAEARRRLLAQIGGDQRRPSWAGWRGAGAAAGGGAGVASSWPERSTSSVIAQSVRYEDPGCARSRGDQRRTVDQRGIELGRVALRGRHRRGLIVERQPGLAADRVGVARQVGAGAQQQLARARRAWYCRRGRGACASPAGARRPRRGDPGAAGGPRASSRARRYRPVERRARLRDLQRVPALRSCSRSMADERKPSNPKGRDVGTSFLVTSGEGVCLPLRR